MNDKLKQRWIAINGSIFVDREVEVKADLGKKYKKRDSIAFNVGQDIAEYIVHQHNKTITVR